VGLPVSVWLAYSGPHAASMLHRSVPSDKSGPSGELWLQFPDRRAKQHSEEFRGPNAFEV
jgi:hypothetical protein